MYCFLIYVIFFILIFSCPSKEELNSYVKKIEFLKGLIEAERLVSVKNKSKMKINLSCKLENRLNSNSNLENNERNHIELH